MTRKISITLLIIAILSILIISIIVKSYEPTVVEDITIDSPQRYLPKGVMARIGKGSVNQLVYSPDGTILAVATGIGLWLYDTNSTDELALLMPHTSRITCLSFSPDGETIVTGSEDAIVRLWDVKTQTLKQIFRGHNHRVFNVVFNSDGKILASSSIGEIIIWDIQTSTQKKTIDRNTTQYSLISYVGNTLILVDVRNKNVEIIDINKEEQVNTIDDLNGYNRVFFCPKGRLLAIVDYRKTIRLMGVNNQKDLIIETDNHHITDVAFSPDGKTLAGSSLDRIIFIWDIDSGKEKDRINLHTGSNARLTYSPDGSTIVSWGNDGIIRFWDLTTKELANTITGHMGWWDFSVSPDGHTVIGHETMDNYTIQLWDTNTGRHTKTLIGHKKSISSIAISPDGTSIASSSYDKTIRLWHPNTGEVRKIMRGYRIPVYKMLFNPDGHILATVDTDHNIRLWDTASGKYLITLNGLTETVKTMVFSSDRKILTSVESDNISDVWEFHVWDINTGELKQKISVSPTNGHRASINSKVLFSPDGQTLAITLSDTSSDYSKWSYIIVMWDVQTGKIKDTLSGHTNDITSIAFNPNGNRLASGGDDKTIRLWDLATGEQKLQISEPLWYQILSAGNDFVTQLSFSPEGQILASGISEGVIYLWDIDTGEQIKILKGHTGSIRKITFNKETKTLMSYSSDGTVMIWDISSILKNVNDNQ
ncbi:hypothetical protein C6497_10005 [Candidatus Poribacteria bacterium]|nr:MAG: hypothetical protein C6497_10005 [Candidatus Poribacteria bacterium]